MQYDNNNVQQQNNNQEQQNQRKVGISDKEAEEKDLKRIMVGNLPPLIKKDELREIVNPFGRVISCEVISQKNFGFVTFLDHKDAAFAIYRLKDKLCQTNKLRADWSEPPSKEAIDKNKKVRKPREDNKIKRVKKTPGSLRFLTPQNPATDQQFTNGGVPYVPKVQQQLPPQQQNYTPPPSSPLTLSQPQAPPQVPLHEDVPGEGVGGDQYQEGGRRNNYDNNRRGRRSRPNPNRGNYNNNNYDNFNNNNNNNFMNNNNFNNPGNNNTGNYEEHQPENQDEQWGGQGNQRNQGYDQRQNQQRIRGGGGRGGRRGGGRGRRNRGGGGRGGNNNNNDQHQIPLGNDQIQENNNNQQETFQQDLRNSGTVEAPTLPHPAVVPHAPVAGVVPPPSGTVPHPHQQKNNFGRQKGGNKQQHQQQQQQYKIGKQQQQQHNVARGGVHEPGDFEVTVANTKTEEVTFKVRLGEDQIEGLLVALQPFLPQPGVV